MAQTTGASPTEFDPTINAVLATLDACGIDDSEIEEDQHYLVNLMLTVGGSTCSQQETMEGMDCAFIGLIYHRHMPVTTPDGQKIQPPRGITDYQFTMNLVVNALIQEIGIPEEVVQRTAQEGIGRAMINLRAPESFTDDGLVLHAHMVMLFIIGILVHRLMPTTTTAP